jgi:hypothetical protein
LSDDASTRHTKARHVRALRASVVEALTEMLEQMEDLRQRQGAPSDVDEFIATTRAVLARLRDEAPPEEDRST